jgi:uncharacterized membrane protein YczE
MYNHCEEGAIMEIFKQDVKRLPVLFFGYVLLALGIYLTKLSTLGMSSWSVFHDGLSIVSGLSFGIITQLLGLIILVISMVFLHTKVGMGTIFNVVFVGWFIDIFDVIYSTVPSNLVLQIIILIFGVLFTTMGRSLYIASKLGPGPRDGLFVGLARVTKIDVKYVKPFIEFIVLGLGILLGGQSGFGTVLIILVSGYLVQFFFQLFHFDAKSKEQSNMFQYGWKLSSFIIIFSILLLTIKISPNLF